MRKRGGLTIDGVLHPTPWMAKQKKVRRRRNKAAKLARRRNRALVRH